MTFESKHWSLLAVLVPVAVSAIATVTSWPIARLAYRSAALHLMFVTAMGLIALFVAFLMHGRFRSGGLANDAALAYALGVYGLSDLTFSALPELVDLGDARAQAVWTPTLARTLATVAIAVAAFVPSRRWTRRGSVGVIVVCSVFATVGLISALVSLGLDVLPAPPDPALSEMFPRRLKVVGPLFLVGAQAVELGAFGIAALGFRRRYLQSEDTLMAWFSAGSVFGLFALFNHFFFPTAYTEWVYTGDALLLAMFALLMVGAIREIGGYWEREAQLAVAGERQRLARDLHDGMAQELAYVLFEGRRVADGEAGASPEGIVKAAQRALDESRRAIAALSASGDEPLDELLRVAAEDVAHRLGVEVESDLASGIDVAGNVRESLVRIVREAVSNAGRHGGASRVTLVLEKGPPLRVVVHDDGTGFDPLRVRAGFGLTSMQDRAAGMGGKLAVRSSASGTDVEVLVG